MLRCTGASLQLTQELIADAGDRGRQMRSHFGEGYAVAVMMFLDGKYLAWLLKEELVAGWEDTYVYAGDSDVN